MSAEAWIALGWSIFAFFCAWMFWRQEKRCRRMVELTDRLVEIAEERVRERTRID